MNRCLIQPSKDERRTYGWHQQVFYTVPNTRAMQTWAPLVESSTEQNGTIEVIPGSHLMGVVRQGWTESNGRNTQIVVDPEITGNLRHRAIELPLGAIVYFDSRLIHRSGVNASGRTRYSLVGMYHDVNTATFRTPRVHYEYRGQTPQQFYQEHFNVESAKAGH